MKKLLALINALGARFADRWLHSYNQKFVVVAGILAAYVAYILWQTCITVFIDGQHYRDAVAKLHVSQIPIPQLRGFIYADGGEMLAGSLPEYDVFLDFRSTTRPDPNTKKLNIPLDTILAYFSPGGKGGEVLHRFDPSRSAEEHNTRIREAYKKREGNFKILSHLPYMEYHHDLRLPSTPYFGKNRNRNGIKTEVLAHRYRPYGDTRMASSTIGAVYAKVDASGESGHGRGGIELALDSVLCGRPGRGLQQKIRNQMTPVVLERPVNGLNVHTTINVEMQQLLDAGLGKRILELNAHGGWAAIMEVKTGKIRAISNLVKEGDHVVEDHNHLFEDLVDPGSTFKTVSYMVMLDDDKITPETIVDTQNYPGGPSGTFYWGGKHISDDHPVGIVTADEGMAQSSNICIAKLVTQSYKDNPQKYFDAIERIGFLNDRILSDSDSVRIKKYGYITGLDFRREFPKAQAARHRRFKDRQWSGMSLGQIAYGYELQIPGIYMLQFYNAIANGGRMMRPYIIDHITDEEGNVIEEFEPYTINKHICKSSTLKAVRHALEMVVDHGTAYGKYYPNGREILPGAYSKRVAIAGKTGTAQRYNTATGTFSGAGHNVSFAGYFPADDPEYCGIVVIDARPGGNFGRPGGGYMAGPVFRDFAEQIYASRGHRKLKELERDTTTSFLPKVKSGPQDETAYILDKLDLDDEDEISYHAVSFAAADPKHVPNVVGMGASDALFLLEKVGLRVSVNGMGTVTSQSIPAGSAVTRGATISITLR